MHLVFDKLSHSKVSDLFHIVESPEMFLPKMVFLPFLMAVLNFCVTYKNMFILETLRDRVISTKFLTAMV